MLLSDSAGVRSGNDVVAVQPQGAHWQAGRWGCCLCLPWCSTNMGCWLCLCLESHAVDSVHTSTIDTTSRLCVPRGQLLMGGGVRQQSPRSDQIYGRQDGVHFHEPAAFTWQGPFSPKSATSDEHPGPPVIQRTTGSVAGADLDSKNQKKY